MKWTVYYAIFSNSRLQEKVMQTDPDRFDILLEPQLWSLDWHDRIPYKREEIDNSVKCLFVAEVRHSFLEHQDIKRIFGELQVSTEEFDKWWKMCRFDGIDNYIPDVADRLLRSEMLGELKKYRVEILRELA